MNANDSSGEYVNKTLIGTPGPWKEIVDVRLAYTQTQVRFEVEQIEGSSHTAFQFSLSKEQFWKLLCRMQRFSDNLS